MTLLDLQTRFQAYIVDDAELTFQTDLLPAAPSAAGRMGVYHHAYRAKLRELLRGLYDKTWTYMGDDLFLQAIDSYVARSPSWSRSLDDYGGSFPEHLAELFPREPDFSELAWLDWSMRRAFDGPNAPSLEASDLAAIDAADWDQARLVFHPTLTWRSVTTNAGALWAGLDEGSPTMPPPLDAPMSVRVWRKGLQPHFRTIDAIETVAIERLSAGAIFAELCESLAQEGVDAPVERAAALLTVWLEDGLLTRIETTSHCPCGPGV